MTNKIEFEQDIGADEMCPYEQLLYKKAAAETEVKFFRRQLKKRFVDLPEWVDEKLDAAESDKLEQWGENFVDAETLEEVFRNG